MQGDFSKNLTNRRKFVIINTVKMHLRKGRRDDEEKDRCSMFAKGWHGVLSCVGVSCVGLCKKRTKGPSFGSCKGRAHS
jgi:hypothetical protein